MLTEATNESEEVWKSIPGYEGIYEVSNHGRVRSLDRNTIAFMPGVGNYTRFFKGKILKQSHFIGSKSSPGYWCVGLRPLNGVRLPCLVHRLVAMTFIPNPENKPTVNHKDGNGKNNHLSNLEWCTRMENNQHAIQTGLHDPHYTKDRPRGERTNTAKLTADQVKVIKKLLPTHTLKEIGAMYGVTNHAIFRIKKGLNWKHIQ
ncbi:NUMOD4 domain-containing protein [Dyadobacter sp. CY312]|uniref:NUMOD4 domain-containing protein n=1 Tax=Dyadobacter sp. CY312 TaxID=2907303 RepID=UPI001F4210E8|nr:NUMOD4 domain-containing protein [Dyadobacter sp. CY312]MCE7039203.1 NUMOD4 motif-containing HNH endonuclease [Dyadobacter sp. CY312]